jgi:hypothetical protein
MDNTTLVNSFLKILSINSLAMSKHGGSVNEQL